jgi:hypothetical protein
LPQASNINVSVHAASVCSCIVVDIVFLPLPIGTGGLSPKLSEIRDNPLAGRSPDELVHIGER